MAAMSNNPNFYIESDDSDSEPINFHLYAGYSFNFVGLPEKTSALCKKIAEHLGARCTENADYVFSNSRYFNALLKNDPEIKQNYYDISFIRDCIDANDFIDITRYKLTEKKAPKTFKYSTATEFEPCCAVFHGTKRACPECDEKSKTSHHFKEEIKFSPVKKAVTNGTRVSSVIKTEVPSEEYEIQMPSGPKKTAVMWTREEKESIVKFIVQNMDLDRQRGIKGIALYQKMLNENLTTRTPDAIRTCVRTHILPHLEDFDIPEPQLTMLKDIASKLEESKKGPSKSPNKIECIKKGKSQVKTEP